MDFTSLDAMGADDILQMYDDILEPSMDDTADCYCIPSIDFEVGCNTFDSRYVRYSNYHVVVHRYGQPVYIRNERVTSGSCTYWDLGSCGTDRWLRIDNYYQCWHNSSWYTNRSCALNRYYRAVCR